MSHITFVKLQNSVKTNEIFASLNTWGLSGLLNTISVAEFRNTRRETHYGSHYSCKPRKLGQQKRLLRH